MLAAGILCWALTVGSAGKMGDASDVTWAHAVNSREALQRELAGPVDFLEADISMGLLKIHQSPFGQYMPIMAHPPETTSDITLEMWIDTVIAANTSKGVKLDFKVLDVVEPSLIILKERAHNMNFTLWLNADILPGPIHSLVSPVKEDIFLLLCQEYFSTAVMSIGWTTIWFPSFPDDTWHYEWSHVRKMADVIRCARFEHSHPTFTFPVRGIFLSRSIRQFQWLLEIVPGSTLTVWTVANVDPLVLDDLLRIRKSFPEYRVFYDLPRDIQKIFFAEKNKVHFTPNSVPSFLPDQWMVLSTDQRAASQRNNPCSSHTYIAGSTVVFGSSRSTAILLKKLLYVNDKRDLHIEGRIQFFDENPEALEVHPNQEFSILIVDVSSHFKNSSEFDSSHLEIDASVSDADVWWPAVNSSSLFTFRRSSTSSNCRTFWLDTRFDRSFQVWVVPCEYMGESFEELTRKGKAEVPYSQRIVLPNRPFMLGFLASGDSYSVIHDLVIDNEVKKYNNSSSVVTKLSIGVLVSLILSIAIHRWIFR